MMRVAWLLLLGLVADAIFSIGINPMGISARQTGVPSILLLAFSAGIGAWWIGRWTSTQVRVPPAVPALVVAILAAGPGLGLPAAPRSLASDEHPALYRDALLREAAPGARVFTSSDDATGIVAYAMGVEGARPDLSQIPLAHLYDLHAWEHLRRLHGPDVIPDAALDRAREADSAGALHTNEGQLRVLETLIGPAADHPPALWELGEGVLDSPLIAARLMGPGFPLQVPPFFAPFSGLIFS